jgi:hypothetical protein
MRCKFRASRVGDAILLSTKKTEEVAPRRKRACSIGIRRTKHKERRAVAARGRNGCEGNRDITKTSRCESGGRMRVLSNVVDQPLNSNLVGTLSASRCRRLTKGRGRTREGARAIKIQLSVSSGAGEFFGPLIAAFGPTATTPPQPRVRDTPAQNP